MQLIKLYQPFFDANNWAHVLTSGQDWMMILTLILMECLLSVDNAVVLAAQTQVLPTKDEQRKSLVYGLWGAYLFRFIVIGIGTYLINFWEIKLLGGLYLLYLVYKYFYDVRHPELVAKKEEAKKENHKKKNSKKRKHHLSLFWRTVISIESMDIVFSMQSGSGYHRFYGDHRSRGRGPASHGRADKGNRAEVQLCLWGNIG